MKAVVIENPILNSPFEMPQRHFKFDEDGITDETGESRRRSSYFIPIASPRKKVKQLPLGPEWTQDRARENDDVNLIRNRGLPGATVGIPTLRQSPAGCSNTGAPGPGPAFVLLPDRGPGNADLPHRGRGEVGRRPDPEQAERRLRRRRHDAVSPGGEDGHRQRQDGRDGHADRLAHAQPPGLSRLRPVRRRLPDRVPRHHHPRPAARLLPSDPNNYYQALDLAPPYAFADLGTAKIVITNYHAFKARERGDAGKLTKTILTGGKPGAFTETPAQMVRRVCRELGSKRNIVVLNDEAHHCYRSRPAEENEKLTGDDRKEAQEREEAARLWINGLEAVQEKIGVKAVYDLSATPFYLRGSGYSEGTLFPWVVSDFSLIDAIESGIVKVPRVPVSDDAMTGDFPTFRDLWYRIRDGLPKKGRGTDAVSGVPQAADPAGGGAAKPLRPLPQAIRGVGEDAQSRADGRTPPVFIVVCNNTNVSKLVFDYVAGYETQAAHPDGAPPSPPASSPSSATRTTADGSPGPTPSWWTASSSNPRRACRPTSRSWPTCRLRSSRPRSAGASPAATPTPSPTRT